jgi:hypothetical protein
LHHGKVSYLAEEKKMKLKLVVTKKFAEEETER